MGFFDRFKQQPVQRKKYSGYFAQQHMIPAPMNTQDYLITYAQSGWLYAATSKIAQAVAESKLIAMKNDQVVESRILDLLNKPNPYQSRFEFMEITDTYLSLTGKAYWMVVKDGKGMPVELWVINPLNMIIHPDVDEFIKGYTYRAGTENVPLDTDEVIFINLPDPNNPYNGIGPAQAAGYVIETDKYSNQWNRNFFFNNAAPDSVMLMEENLDDDSFDRLKQQWNDKYRGVDNAKKTAILEGVKDIKVLSTNARDMDFANLKSANRDELLAIFGVSKVILGMTEAANYASSAVAKSQFVENTVRPRLIRLESKINNELVPLFGKKEANVEIKFVENIPENSDFIVKTINDGVNAGYISKDEARERIGQLLGMQLQPMQPTNPSNTGGDINE